MPRLRPLSPDAWPEDMRTLASGKFGAANVMQSLMHRPDLFRRWSVFANHFLFKGALPAETREILILRTAWVTGSEYEWGPHLKPAADECGFDKGHFRDLQIGARGAPWNPPPKARLRLADGPIPGRAPISVPRNTPAKANIRFVGVNAIEKPRNRSLNNSITRLDFPYVQKPSGPVGNGTFRNKTKNRTT